MNITEIQKEISILEQRLNDLRNQLELEQNKELMNDAYKNSYEALNESFQITNTPETAIPIKFPMFYQSNVYYKITEVVETGIHGVDGDGNDTLTVETIEVTKIFTCNPKIRMTRGILTKENFNDVMIPYNEEFSDGDFNY